MYSPALYNDVNVVHLISNVYVPLWLLQTHTTTSNHLTCFSYLINRPLIIFSHCQTQHSGIFQNEFNVYRMVKPDIRASWLYANLKFSSDLTNIIIDLINCYVWLQLLNFPISLPVNILSMNTSHMMYWHVTKSNPWFHNFNLFE
jgi:hypothetical protein